MNPQNKYILYDIKTTEYTIKNIKIEPNYIQKNKTSIMAQWFVVCPPTVYHDNQKSMTWVQSVCNYFTFIHDVTTCVHDLIRSLMTT